MYDSARNGKKVCWQMAVFGGSSGSAAVSSQFLIKHHKGNFMPKIIAVTLCLADFLRWF